MTLDFPDLTGKVAIVTGASRGIGKELALALARQGAAVVVAAKTVEPKEHLPGSIHETVSAIEELGGRALAVRTNVRDAEAVENLVATTVKEFGRVDLVVHNAGALWWRPILETPAKRFDLVHEVNVRAGFLLTAAALPHMIEQGDGGHFLFIAPPIELSILPQKTAYLISKYSVTMLAMGLAAEAKEHNVSANCLWPATAVESQATINHGMGTREQWRKPSVLSDAMLVMFGKSADELSGQALLDEEVLRNAGVTDFEPYNCVPGGKPMYITGKEAFGMQWTERAGMIEGKK